MSGCVRYVMEQAKVNMKNADAVHAKDMVVENVIATNATDRVVSKMKYKVVLADCPWKYNDKMLKNGGAEKHYPTMTTMQLCNMGVRDIADNNSMLFMWCTWPMLEQSIIVMHAWGFKYKTDAFIWIKTTKNGNYHFGTGLYTRANSEPCLLGIRGKPKVESHSISQLIITQRGKHSEKPPIVMDKIVELCGDVPRIELFSRSKKNGWAHHGNEIDGGIKL